ncbi:MAG: aminoglycoside phosphotransferase family protein, partial [Woeseiaceae bacterium]|nr:aminoglycoside phosphotransferase family protein [Woeseiaceae bacterium]
DETGEAVCVIDLDTVMPGLALFDFGDMVRTMTTAAAEDRGDSQDITMRMDYYEAIAAGYLDTAGHFLSPDEIAHMPDAGKLLTVETGLRFLTDYLDGDQYFRTSREGQNLDRCRTQFALADSIDSHMGSMRKIAEKLVR